MRDGSGGRVRACRDRGVGGGAAACGAVFAAVCAVGLAGACSPELEPLLAATCAPDPAMDKLTCTVKNHGKKASRACFRARLTPETGEALVLRRVCTGVIEPGQSASATPQLERMGRVQAEGVLPPLCVRYGEWACKIDVVETSREMAEDQPRLR